MGRAVNGGDADAPLVSGFFFETSGHEGGDDLIFPADEMVLRNP